MGMNRDQQFTSNVPAMYHQWGGSGSFVSPTAMAWNFKALPNEVQKTINMMRFDGTPSAKALNSYQIDNHCKWPGIFVKAIDKINCLYKRRVAMPRQPRSTLCRCDGDHYCPICKHDPRKIRTRTTRDMWILPRSFLSAHERKVLTGRA